MSKQGARPENLSGIVGGTVEDIEKLIGQHFDLMRSELKGELHKVESVAASLGAGAGAATLGGILGALMAVHLLHAATRLPLWLCYGIVGGGLGAAGAGLLYQGARTASDVNLVPKQTAEALREEFGGARREPAGAR